MANEYSGRTIIVAAHGSRVEAANQELLQIVQDLRRFSDTDRVLPAFLELVSPDVPTAIDQAIQDGAAEVIVVPYFLLFGGHIQEDFPSIVAAASVRHPLVRIRLADPIGFHPLLVDIIVDRLSQWLKPS